MIHMEAEILKVSVVIEVFSLSLPKKKTNKQLSETDVYISYLPLAHVFDRAIEECIIQVGGSIGFWRGVSTAQKLDLSNQPTSHEFC